MYINCAGVIDCSWFNSKSNITDFCTISKWEKAYEKSNAIFGAAKASRETTSAYIETTSTLQGQASKSNRVAKSIFSPTEWARLLRSSNVL